MIIHCFHVLSLVTAQTQFHYTERYRYTTEISQYLCRGYMVVNQTRPIFTGTVYPTTEQAQDGLVNLQDWLRRIGKPQIAEQLVIAPYDFTETVCKKRAYKLTGRA